MFIFEIEATDVYSVLGRVLDRTRVAGLRLASVTAQETEGAYAISATVDTANRDVVDRLARQFRGMINVASVNVERGTIQRPSESGFAALKPPAQSVAAKGLKEATRG